MSIEILVVEDDDAIAEPLLTGLRREGFGVRRAATGAEALAAPPVDLVLLDLGLPDMDGNEVCRTLRSRSDVPIIVVTARGEEIDRVLGLELGADDYVVKPFGFRELVARIRAVMRRKTTTPPPASEEYGALRLERRTRRVFVKETEVVLTAKEFDLLAMLMEDPGAVADKRRILEQVWESRWFGPTKTIDVHVSAIRRKLGDARWIETVRGVGFRMGEPQ